MKVICDYCGQPADLVTGDAIYPHRRDLYSRRFWLCQPCDAYVGTHRNSPEHAPLGRLADAELRSLKQAVHAKFDPLWQSGRYSRHGAYQLLAGALGIDPKECHVGMFSPERCRLALKELEEFAR